MKAGFYPKIAWDGIGLFVVYIAGYYFVYYEITKQISKKNKEKVTMYSQNELNDVEKEGVLK